MNKKEFEERIISIKYALKDGETRFLDGRVLTHGPICTHLNALVCTQSARDFRVRFEKEMRVASYSCFWLGRISETNVMYRYLVLELFEQWAIETKVYLKY